MIKNNFVYTYIIPHHNCPDLLDRCINSIPQRDDIQIIVVDDNSDVDKKPIECGRPEVQYVYINNIESKGAGHARNRGLLIAKGKWIVFADSDDFFEKEVLNRKMNEYMTSDADVIFFNSDKLNAETLEPKPGTYIYSDVISKNNETSIEWLRYRSNVPWGKFIKKELITLNNLRFSECIAGNDVFFSVTSGHYSSNTIVDIDIVYHWCLRSKDNISSNMSKESILSKYEQAKLRNNFLLSVEKKEWVSNLYIKYLNYFIKLGYGYIEIITILWRDTPCGYRIKHLLEAVWYFTNRFMKNSFQSLFIGKHP